MLTSKVEESTHRQVKCNYCGQIMFENRKGAHEIMCPVRGSEGHLAPPSFETVTEGAIEVFFCLDESSFYPVIEARHGYRYGEDRNDQTEPKKEWWELFRDISFPLGCLLGLIVEIVLELLR